MKVCLPFVLCTFLLCVGHSTKNKNTCSVNVVMLLKRSGGGVFAFKMGAILRFMMGSVRKESE